MLGGKEVQSAIVHWGKGKEMGGFPKLPSEILLGGKRVLPLPGGAGPPGTLYPRCWGRLTGPGVFLGLSLPTSTTEETFQAFAQSQLLQLTDGGPAGSEA